MPDSNWFADWDADRQQREAEQVIQNFKRQRAEAIATATVTTQAGNTFDADETSIARMAARLQRMRDNNASKQLGWVLADSEPGQKTTITKSELEEAFDMAVDLVDQNWSQE